jgi:hypothetical protein
MIWNKATRVQRELSKPRFRRRPALCLEPLEDRCVPATIFDNNVGSLMLPVQVGPASGSLVAEQLVPTQNATLNSATLTLANDTLSTGAGSLQLYSDNNGVPGSTLGSPATFTLTSTSPTPVNIPIAGSIPVTSDHAYWIVASSGAATSTYFWESAGSNGFSATSDDGGTIWTQGFDQLRMSLDGTITPPTITSLSAPSGVQGDSITITGTNFAAVSTVSFNNAQANFMVVSPTQITATVPAGATTGPVTVTTTAGTASSPSDFIVNAPSPPTITNLSPSAGASPGDTVTITGTNFINPTSVLFNGVPGTITSSSPTSITAVVPGLATTGPVQVVTPAGIATSSPYTITPSSAPTITGLSELSGVQGDSVTITGTNFNAVQSVTFADDQQAVFIVVSPTQIMATVPDDAEDGPVTVVTASGTAVSPNDFTIAAPTVASFNPPGGAIGSQVVITGSNFTGAFLVLINDSPILPADSPFIGPGIPGFTVDSPTQITVQQVPDDATTGPIVVLTPGGIGISATNFTVGQPAPTVTAVPPSGSPGQTITINGTDLTNVQAVSFNGAPADSDTFDEVSDTELTVEVPVGATTGPITVVTPGGSAQSTTFTVTPAPAPSITMIAPDTGSVGDMVVLTGSGFTGASDVLFTGARVEPLEFSVDSDSQITVDSIPVGAQTGPITVITPGGVATSGTFTIVPPTIPAPSITGLSASSGTVGDNIVITGSGLTSATAVTFNGVPAARFFVDADTQIEAIVPAAATTGPIVVVTPGGIATSPGPFTFDPTPPPAITGFSSSSAPVGTIITIDGTNLNGAQTVLFNGTGATFQVLSPTQIAAQVPLHVTSGPILIQTLGGKVVSDTSFMVPAPVVTGLSTTTGPVGTQLVIAGNNFQDATAVAFNGVPVPPSKMSVDFPTQLTVTVPAGATPGPITVTTASGSTTTGTFAVTSAGAPTITGFSLPHGLAGDTIFITGTNLQGTTSVTFNGVAVALSGIIVNSPTQLTVTVPPGASTGPVVVTAPGGTATSPTSFMIDAPTITSLTPSSATVGSLVIITGDNFTGATAVSFNGVFVPLGTGSLPGFSIDSATQITVNVPAGATTGPISVVTPGGIATSNFTVLPFAAPTITSVAVNSGPVGSTVYIFGTNLLSNGTATVTFNGVEAQLAEDDLLTGTINTDNELIVTVPNGATTGPIQVTTGGGTALSPTNFTVTTAAPTILAFNPTSGPAGIGVTIFGTNFTGATAVLFNGVPVTNGGNPQLGVQVISPTIILVTNVPAGATTGPITVVTPSGTAVSGTPFTVAAAAPTISGFTPGSGTADSSVIILGSGFTNASEVLFGGVPVLPNNLIVNSDTQITVTVPLGAMTGPITVVAPGGTIASASPFTVTASPAPTITGFTPSLGTSGSTIIITGTNFLGASAVLFDGIPINPLGFTIDSPTEITVSNLPSNVLPGSNTVESSGPITVVTPGGVAVSAQSISLTGQAPPTISGIEPSDSYADIIFGTGFTNVSNVLFNNTPVVYVVISSTQIGVSSLPPGNGNFSVVTAGGTATSALVTTTVPAPTITGFTPTSGLPGSMFIITGTHFTGATAVTLDGVPLSPTTGFTVENDTQILTLAPFGATGNLVSVVTPGGIAISSTKFTTTTPPAPTVAAVSPTSAPIGATITITGTNFTLSSIVTFNGTQATSVQVLSPTALTVVVPGGATTGPLMVSTGGGQASGGTFTIQGAAPTISGLSVGSASVGGTVIITGTGFTDVTAVQVNGVTVGPLGFYVYSPTQITVTVPVGATTGPITVTTPQGTATSAALTVTAAAAPTISAATPNVGPVGVTVVITGTNFTPDSVVTFNGVPVNAASGLVFLSPTELQVNVPAQATSGPLNVTTVGGTASVSFTIPAPMIASVTPSSGAPGATVIINGLGLAGATSVTLTMGATIIPLGFQVNSPTQLSATIPLTATTGPGTIAVTTAGGTATTSMTVVPSAAPTLAALTPANGVVGDAVILTGTGLTAATAVLFNGFSAQFTVNSDTQITAIVPVGAGTGTVSVTTPGGTATSSGLFRVSPSGLPIITAATETNAGGEAIITGFNFNHVTAVRFIVNIFQGPMQPPAQIVTDVPSADIIVDSPTQLRVPALAPLAGDGLSTQVVVVTPAGIGMGFINVLIPSPPSISSFGPSSGPAGTTLLIFGTNFTYANAVGFQGAQVNLASLSNPNGFTILSDTEISVPVPPGATTGPISVTSSTGTATSVTSFTVTAAPAPTITTFPASGTAGTSVTISGANFLGATSVAFNGLAAAGFQVVDPQTIIATVPTGATSGPIAVTTPSGTATSTDSTSAPASFTVLPLAAPTITGMSMTTGPVGTLVQLTGSDLVGVTSVTFNGVTADFGPAPGVVQGSALEAVVPVGASSGPVVVTTSGGTATSPSNFSVLAPLPPTATGFSLSSGAVGDTVIITGYGFFGATSVTFDGVPATFTLPAPLDPLTGSPALLTLDNATQITATVPIGAATGPLVITTPSGTATAGTFTVTTLPTAVVSSFSPSGGLAGTTVTITGAGFSGATLVTFNGVPTGFTVVSNTEITALVPAAATTGTIAVVGAGGTGISATSFTVTPTLLVTVPNPGQEATVTFTNQVTGKTFTIDVFPGFMGGVRTAVADVTGDGTPDLIVAAGPGGGPAVRIFDGNTGQQILGPLGSFFAFNPIFGGGVYVAAGDLNGDGHADVIVSADQGGGPQVNVYNGADGSLLYAFFAYNPAFIGGTRVALGDLNGNGQLDLVVGAGPGGGPQVNVYRGSDGAFQRAFFAFDPNFTQGVFVATGDLTGAGHDDIIVGAGVGGGPEVISFDGITGAEISAFFAYDPTISTGVRVASLAANGQSQIITGLAPNGGQIHAYDALTTQQVDQFFAGNPLFNSSVFQGSSA